MPHLLQPLMSQKTHTKPKNTKKKSSATKLRSPLQTPNLKKKNLKQFHKTNPTHKNTKSQKQKLPANSNLDLIRKLLSIQGLSSLPVRQCNPLRNHILWNSQQKNSANPIQPPREELKEWETERVSYNEKNYHQLKVPKKQNLRVFFQYKRSQKKTKNTLPMREGREAEREREVLLLTHLLVCIRDLHHLLEGLGYGRR